MKGSDLRKLSLAELLWKGTTVSREWITEKLSMRSAANMSQRLRRFDRTKACAKLPLELQSFLMDAWMRDCDGHCVKSSIWTPVLDLEAELHALSHHY